MSQNTKRKRQKSPCGNTGDSKKIRVNRGRLTSIEDIVELCNDSKWERWSDNEKASFIQFCEKEFRSDNENSDAQDSNIKSSNDTSLSSKEHWVHRFVNDVQTYHDHFHKLRIYLKNETKYSGSIKKSGEDMNLCDADNNDVIDVGQVESIKVTSKDASEEDKEIKFILRNDNYKKQLSSMQQFYDPKTIDIAKQCKETYGTQMKIYIPEMVHVHDASNSSFTFQERGKETALVISGESGAGKTQYALSRSSEFNATIYLSLGRQNHNEYNELKNMERDEDEMNRIKYYDAIIKFLEENETKIKAFAPTFDVASVISEIVNHRADNFKSRNDWAVTKIDQLISDNVGGLEKLYFIKDDENEVKVNSLLLIIDEAVKNVYLVRALLDMTRTLLDRSKYLKKMTKRMGLILCGTGLDLIENDLESDRLGSDPRIYKLVTMKQVDFETIIKRHESSESNIYAAMKEWAGIWQAQSGDKEYFLSCIKTLFSCIKDGKRLKVISSNARMFSMGVVPLLLSEFFSGCFHMYGDDEAEKRRKSKVAEASNCQHVMDYVLRKYISLNSLNEVVKEEGRMDTLLDSAFTFLLWKSVTALDSLSSRKDAKCLVDHELLYGDSFLQEFVEKLDSGNSNIVLENIAEGEQEKVQECFKRGVCTPDPKTTSDAMKYFICRGQSLFVDKGCGLAFEELIVNFLHRLYSVKAKVLPKTYMLKTQLEYNSTKKKTMKRIKKEIRKLRANEPNCSTFIITQPSENKAAGPDVIVWKKVNETEWSLDLYQAKHLTRDTLSKLNDKVITQITNSLFLKESEKNECYEEITSIEQMFTKKESYATKVSGRFLQLSNTCEDLFKKNKEKKAKLIKPCAKIRKAGIKILPREFLQPTYDMGRSFVKVEE